MDAFNYQCFRDSSDMFSVTVAKIVLFCHRNKIFSNLKYLKKIESFKCNIHTGFLTIKV